MATSTTSHRPIKGILKNKGSTASSGAAMAQQSGGALPEVQRKKSQKWDESSIMATYHSPYADYDFMKTNEPSTAQLGLQEDREGAASDFETEEAMILDSLAKKLAATSTSELSYQVGEPERDRVHASKIFLDKQEKQRQFEMKRKLHYNEGLNIKLARQLISKDLQCEDEEGEHEESRHATSDKTTPKDADGGLTADELETQSRYV
ncbi:Protein phosphatase inhibitor 2 [Camelus dromedarius]|uniref:Protein phosphatase inhibitor 2 n=1 Tax=Camelus dromedarius TaxID=9838 RepID=A0A5N4C1E5_CAMDR|nr:protein phosphatase inhibitor 2 family member C [Camelus dromedarius]KAB1252678.1 Protein phosphatase inhibitor 2 [Camelus dromedarius]